MVKNKLPYENILIKASKGMMLVKDLNTLCNLIVRIIKKHVCLKSVAMFQYSDAEDSFMLRSRRGDNYNLIGTKIKRDDPLIKLLKKKKKAFLSKEIHSDETVKREIKELKYYLCVPSIWRKNILGFFILGRKISGENYSAGEIKLLSALSNEVAMAIENLKKTHEVAKLREREKKNYIETILALARTVDEKDTYTRGHLDKVAKYGMELAKELKESNLADIDMEELKIGLLLHDIGKIGIPDALLNKTEKLSDEEWAIMKQHPEIGERIIKPVSKLKKIGRIIRHHQEKYDGTGYPDGLKGDNIPLASRIIAVVDAYHAMVSDRPYRKALPEEAAVKELIDNKCKQFDPVIVDAFLKAHKKGKIK